MKLNVWPGFLLLLLGANVGVVVVTMTLANRDGGPIVTPAYDARATQWDAFRAEQAKSDSLGWTLAARLVPLNAKAGELRIAIKTDAASITPPSNITLHITLFHNAHPGRPLTLQCITDEAGAVTEPVPLEHAGLYTLLVESPATPARPGFRTELEIATARPTASESSSR